MEQLMNMGRWKSDTVARGYIDSSEKTFENQAEIMQKGHVSMTSNATIQHKAQGGVDISGSIFNNCVVNFSG